MIFLLLLLLPTSFVGSALSQNICEEPVDLGKENCTTSNATIRFYYDLSLKRCAPFLYSGCGGNKNNFLEFKECHQRCVPIDHLFCPANSPPLPNTVGKNDCGKEPSDAKCASPSISYCNDGPNGVGICCSTEARDNYNKDIKPTCSNGKEKYSVAKFGKNIVVLGKICAHNFCPDKFECQQGIYFAYCCAK
ncbi:unnamed protein product [Caenorhabditis brenneri]